MGETRRRGRDPHGPPAPERLEEVRDEGRVGADSSGSPLHEDPRLLDTVTDTVRSVGVCCSIRYVFGIGHAAPLRLRPCGCTPRLFAVRARSEERLPLRAQVVVCTPPGHPVRGRGRDGSGSSDIGVRV